MELQHWGDLYKELAQRITAEPNLANWVDLWHNQINFLTEEHPFPVPAVFIAFRMRDPEDTGENVQIANLQIDLYYFFETFADTFSGSFNQDDALDYLNGLTVLHRLFHGSEGNTFSNMQRVGMAPVDTGSAGNLYRISFVCNVVDISAQKQMDSAVPGDIALTQGTKPDSNEPPLFDINLG